MSVTPFPTVAPEFISVLREEAEETLLAYLRETNAPQAVIDLAEHVHLLAHAEKPLPGLPSLAIETVNLIAECGGVFHSATGSTYPREAAK